MAIVANATKIHKCKRAGSRAGQGRQGNAKAGRLRTAAECSGVLPDVVAKPRGRSSTERNGAAGRSLPAQRALPALPGPAPCSPLTPEALS